MPDNANSSDDRLRLLIERIERLEEEKKGIADDIRDVYSKSLMQRSARGRAAVLRLFYSTRFACFIGLIPRRILTRLRWLRFGDGLNSTE